MKSKLTALFFVLMTAILAAQDNDSTQLALFTEERRLLQGKFSTCQAMIYPNPDLAPAEAQLNMEEINKEIRKLSSEVLAFEQARYVVWANASFWTFRTKSGRVVSYWDGGPSAKFVLQKLDVQLGKLKFAKIAVAGPFKRPDLNASQQTLDAIRASLELDAEIARMIKQYLNR
jgi:hypothetical protein